MVIYSFRGNPCINPYAGALLTALASQSPINMNPSNWCSEIKHVLERHRGQHDRGVKYNLLLSRNRSDYVLEETDVNKSVYKSTNS